MSLIRSMWPVAIPVLSGERHSSPAEVSRGLGIFALGVGLPGPVWHHVWGQGVRALSAESLTLCFQVPVNQKRSQHQVR